MMSVHVHTMHTQVIKLNHDLQPAHHQWFMFRMCKCLHHLHQCEWHLLLRYYKGSMKRPIGLYVHRFGACLSTLRSHASLQDKDALWVLQQLRGCLCVDTFEAWLSRLGSALSFFAPALLLCNIHPCASKGK